MNDIKIFLKLLSDFVTPCLWQLTLLKYYLQAHLLWFTTIGSQIGQTAWQTLINQIDQHSMVKYDD